jgi:prepilin-type N-terminal cleavage/methylation domain-containing protein
MHLKSIISGTKGFTLVEIIVTLVAAGILAIFYFHFMGTAMDYSWRSVELVAGEAQAEGIMERIIADYVDRINQDPDNALANIKGTNYGTLVTMVYVTYDSAGNESEVTVGTSDYLKVTIKLPVEDISTTVGNNLTTLLTKSRSAATDPIVFF